MTFPSSPFPYRCPVSTSEQEPDPRSGDCGESQCMRCNPEPGDHYCTLHDVPLERREVCLYCTDRFPVLRSSPLWAQTWVPHLWHRRFHGDSVDVGSGNWFPPLQCGPNGFGDRKKFVDSRGRDWLLYSTDNCPDCTAALQAVELMVYSVAWEFAQWPDEWEHRCWFAHRNGGCWCGQFSRVLSGEWKLWWPDGYGLRLQKPTTTASIIDLIRSTLIEPIVAEWSSYEP